MKFTKEGARRTVLNCAKQYQEKLANKTLLIVYRERRDNSIQSIEVTFYPRNYQHLTGVEMQDEEGNTLRNQSINFYRKCIENKLSTDEIRFKNDGTTQLKLQALPALMDVKKITKITGDYNGRRPYLLVDKIMGGVNFCLGLTKEGSGYIPSSALLEDIRNLTNSPSQVLAIFEKDKGEEIYRTIRHVAKGLNIHNIDLPIEIQEKICMEMDVEK